MATSDDVQPTDNKESESLNKEIVSKWLRAGVAEIVDNNSGTSDVWKLFGLVQKDHKVVAGYVACKTCSKVGRSC